MSTKTKKATFSLSEDVLSELHEAVARGEAASKNALVERALVQELAALRRKERRRQWEEAMRDPLFLKDIQEVSEAFASADAESLRGA